MGFSPRTLAGVGAIPGAPLAIGRYQILDLIATGGMAEVYLARHGELSGYQTAVVVKRILPHLARDERFIEMFLDEGRIAAALDHPNIARVIEVGHAGQEYFMAMELVQGESLASIASAARAKKVHISPSMASLMIAHAAAGLHHAHTLTDPEGNPLHIVHRDVSPQNILVSFEGAVKVIDFGVARALGRVTHTKTGSMKGKIAYMAPEQARGAPVDQRTDVFALGVVLWETLTGHRLFARENELATMRAIMDERYPSVCEHVEVKPMLDAIVKQALDPDPSRRFGSAQELEIALEKYIATEGFIGAGDVSREMKALFPDEHLRWAKWVRASVALPASAEAAAAHRTPSIVQEGEGPTQILGRGQRPDSAGGNVLPGLDGPPGATPTPAMAMDDRSSSTPPVSGAVSTSHGRLWTYLGLAWVLLVAGGIGFGVMFVRSRPAAPAPGAAMAAPNPMAAPLPSVTPLPSTRPDDMSDNPRSQPTLAGDHATRASVDRDHSRSKSSGKKRQAGQERSARSPANSDFKPNPF